MRLLLSSALLLFGAIGIACGDDSLALFDLTPAGKSVSDLRDKLQFLRMELLEERQAAKAAGRPISDSLDPRELAILEQFQKIAKENPGTTAEFGALHSVARYWPKEPAAKVAEALLREKVFSVDLTALAIAFNTFGVQHGTASSIAPTIVERVKESPDHPHAGRLLAEACTLMAPTDGAPLPPEFTEAANMIRDRYAASAGIVHFCEILGRYDYTSAWAAPFEPHLRKIAEVNKDRFILCTAKLGIALMAQAAGESRQAEAEKLFAEYISEFDGTVQYHGQGIEKEYREAAQRQLATIRSHGIGKPAPEIDGIGLDGKPMKLSELRGKVVLVSFWATWCGPCMKLIPHEKEIAERFTGENFAIVGVNGDYELASAVAAVEKHSIPWRSFVVQSEGKENIALRWIIAAWPTLYLLDSEGIVRERWNGTPPPCELEISIEQLLANEKNRTGK